MCPTPLLMQDEKKVHTVKKPLPEQRLRHAACGQVGDSKAVNMTVHGHGCAAG